PEQEEELLEKHLNRVTDTCIPEEEAIRVIENVIISEWKTAQNEGKSYFPHEYLYRVIRSGKFKGSYQIPEKDSWLIAACEKNLPIFVPGWEDSTLGNIFVSHTIKGSLNTRTMKSGLDYMKELITWYTEMTTSTPAGVGFFQIGGGIAGDFPICVVPLINQDLEKDVPEWTYFCQI